MQNPKYLNLLAAVGQLGYGVTGFNILKALVDQDWEVALFSKGAYNRTVQSELDLIQNAISKSKTYPVKAHCLQIWHQFDLAYKVGNGKHFAMPIFELDKFTEQEVHHLRSVDVRLVCSQWAADVLMENGVFGPTFILPLGVDLSIFKPLNTNQSKYVFLNIGKWEIRKGHDILVDIFNKAFTKKDDVELWLAPHNPFLSRDEAKSWESLYLDTPLGKAGKIKILPWQSTQKDLANLIAQSSCGIFPTRAEGWNLEALEMMAMNKPVITTYYSGHTEYCKVDNSFLINVDETESAYDGKWFFDQGNWAKLGQDQFDQFVEHMRLVYYNGINTNEAGVQTARSFTWDSTATRLGGFLLDFC